MSENQAPTENQEQAATEDTKVEDVLFNLAVGDCPDLPLIEHYIDKGPHKGKFQYYIQFDGKATNPFSKSMQAVGVENHNTAVAGIYRQAVKDSIHDATDENGKVDFVKFSQNLVDWFKPSSRKKTGGIKELREKLAELQTKMTPFALRMGNGETLTPEDYLMLTRLGAEYREINTKIEGSARKGKKKDATTVVAAS